MAIVASQGKEIIKPAEPEIIFNKYWLDALHIQTSHTEQIRIIAELTPFATVNGVDIFGNDKVHVDIDDLNIELVKLGLESAGSEIANIKDGILQMIQAIAVAQGKI